MMNFLGDNPFPYLIFSLVLMVLGIGNIVRTIQMESAKKGETGKNATKERYRNASSGLVVSLAFIALSMMLFAIGLSKF